MAIIRKKGKILKQTEVSLPTELSKPVGEIGGYAALLFGEKKIGKTSLAAQFEKTVFMMFEPGAKHLSIYQRSVNTWKEFKGYVDLLIATKEFKTVVIDPVDKCYDLCFRYVCTKLVIDHPADEGWGKGWDAIRNEFVGTMDRLLRSGKGIIFISHGKEQEIEERGGKKYTRLTNTMKGQAKECIEGAVDIWAHYGYEGRERVLTILGDDFIDAGHRLNEPPTPRFLYTNGKPIRKIPMGKSSKEAYENFMKAFNNQLIEEGGKESAQPLKKKLGIKLKSKIK